MFVKRVIPLPIILFFWVLSAITSSVPYARAADYPSRPIHIIIPYSAGSPTDTYTRKIADVAQGHLGAPIVIENKPGASGVLGAAQLARSAPDGYSLMVTTSDPLIAGTVMIKSVPYNSMKDFRFVTKLYVSTPVFVINASTGISTLDALIRHAKLRPTTYGSFGPGSFHQLSIEEFARLAGIKLSEIPYRSPAQAALAVLSNEVSLGYIPAIQVLDYIREAKITALSVIGTRRLKLIPEVPTFSELGFNAYILRNAFWTGVVGPAGIPEDAVAKILDGFHRAMSDPEIKRFFAQVGNEIIANSPDEFDREIREEYGHVLPLIKSINVESK